MAKIKAKLEGMLPQSTNCADNANYSVHLAGFEGSMPVTCKCTISNQEAGNITTLRSVASICTGYTVVTETLASLYGSLEEPTEHMPLFGQMSLKEGIRYAEFLIRTTELHQQFSRALPKVGGNIDVAVITPLDGFEWVRQQLYLEEPEAIIHEQ